MIGAARQTHISKYVEYILQYMGTSGSEFRVNTYTAGEQEELAICQTGTGFVVAWQSMLQDGDGRGVYAQRYAVDGTALGSEFRVNTTTASYQHKPAICQTSDGFVVAWESQGQDGSSTGVYAQRYAVDGTALGSEFRVNTYTNMMQELPAICQTSDGFVVAWPSWNQDGNNYGIYAQRYAVNGTALGSEFRVNTYTNDEQNYPTICQTSVGFVVAWESRGQDGSSDGIYAQRYAVDGTALGSEFRVNTTTLSAQVRPAICQTSNGFAVAWTAYDQDGSSTGVYAQRYAVDGTALGSEFRVNTYTNDVQQNPTMCQTIDDGFAIAWRSTGQDADGSAIYAKRYAVDGTALGSEFRVNTTTAGWQLMPGICQTNVGFVVAWNSYGQDGDVGGIYAQRYVYIQ